VTDGADPLAIIPLASTRDTINAARFSAPISAITSHVAVMIVFNRIYSQVFT
jgi:hypothetical protein